jgi:hypothetical protein
MRVKNILALIFRSKRNTADVAVSLRDVHSKTPHLSSVRNVNPAEPNQNQPEYLY